MDIYTFSDIELLKHGKKLISKEQFDYMEEH